MARLAALFTVMIIWGQFSFAAAAREVKTLTLVHYGFWNTIENDVPVETKEYRLSYGDTARQDAIANSPSRSAFGAFAMNAAFYFHNADGTWNLFNFRLPSESLTDPKALEERQRFRDYLSREDVRKVIAQPYEKVDFGQPTDFIYKRMGLKTEELPEPFNRLRDLGLDATDSIFQYNADGTAKIYFRKPYDLEGKVEPVFESLKENLTR